MSHFHVYVDRENGSQISRLQTPLARGLRTAPVGKTFSSNQTAPMVARKVLEDVKNQQFTNSDVRSNEKLQPKYTIQCQPVALLKSFSGVKQTSSQDSSLGVRVADEKSCHVRQHEVESIEHMIPYNEEEDDESEDLWPVAERPTTHLREIEHCRPPVFGSVSTPDTSSNDTASDDEFVPHREVDLYRTEGVLCSEDFLIVSGPLDISLNEHECLFSALDD